VSACPSDAALADYWFGDLPEAEADAVEEHAFECDGCSARLQELAGLREGVRELVRTGRAPVVIAPSFLGAASREGLRIREYAVGPGESVACTVTAEDDLVVSRLRADLRGVARVDLIAEPEGGGAQRAEDVPFDAATGEVILAQSMPMLRALPTSTFRIRLVAPDDAGAERVLGEYTFAHTRGR
jgi:hypothetical protein